MIRVGFILRKIVRLYWDYSVTKRHADSIRNQSVFRTNCIECGFNTKSMRILYVLNANSIRIQYVFNKYWIRIQYRLNVLMEILRYDKRWSFLMNWTTHNDNIILSERPAMLVQNYDARWPEPYIFLSTAFKNEPKK